MARYRNLFVTVPLRRRPPTPCCWTMLSWTLWPCCTTIRINCGPC
ncbi:ORFL255C.iORF1 [Human betaherpesvirus 5]|nr:ORFL255C.iORF1 [Human betaherpesvirus 5]QHX40632.1 ORFL255C.iORF1 [Human betaherpesvirus 5]